MHYMRFEHGRWETLDGQVASEELVRLHVNGRELTRWMCTPQELHWLALGFLRSEGIIESMADVRLVKVCPSQTCVEVWLRDAHFEPPSRVTMTSGCGGGVTFADVQARAEPLEADDVRVTPQQLGRLMQSMLASQRMRGAHIAALAQGETLLVISEDVGRHNAVDKVGGYCLQNNISTTGCILLCTGRISSEMLYKAARMEVPVVVSRTSPTSLAVALAKAWHMTLVGHVRRSSLDVYAGRERIIVDEEETTDAHS